jgi:hypothetical protein
LKPQNNFDVQHNYNCERDEQSEECAAEVDVNLKEENIRFRLAKVRLG